MTVTISSLDLAQKVVDLAKATPKHIYKQPEDVGQMCSYVHGTRVEAEPSGLVREYPTGKETPGCIVGAALLELGITPEQILHGDQQVGTSNGMLGKLVRIGALSITDVPDPILAPSPALAFVRDVQGNQDVGIPWGEAVEKALFLSNPFSE